jgi:hypothetical protein
MHKLLAERLPFVSPRSIKNTFHHKTLTTETVLLNTENELSLLCLCHSAFIQLFAVGVVSSACRLLPANLGQMTDNRVFYCRPINAIQSRQKQPGSK